MKHTLHKLTLEPDDLLGSLVESCDATPPILLKIIAV